MALCRFVSLEDAEETIKSGVPPEARREAPAAVNVANKILAKPAVAANPAAPAADPAAAAAEPKDADNSRAVPPEKPADSEAPARAKVCHSLCLLPL